MSLMVPPNLQIWEDVLAGHWEVLSAERESGKPTAAQVSELLAENVVFNSPILVRPIDKKPKDVVREG